MSAASDYGTIRLYDIPVIHCELRVLDDTPSLLYKREQNLANDALITVHHETHSLPVDKNKVYRHNCFRAALQVQGDKPKRSKSRYGPSDATVHGYSGAKLRLTFPVRLWVSWKIGERPHLWMAPTHFCFGRLDTTYTPFWTSITGPSCGSPGEELPTPNILDGALNEYCGC